MGMQQDLQESINKDITNVVLKDMDDLIHSSDSRALQEFDGVVRGAVADAVRIGTEYGMTREQMLDHVNKTLQKKMDEFPSQSSAILSTRSAMIVREEIEKMPSSAFNLDRERVQFEKPAHGMAQGQGLS